MYLAIKTADEVSEMYLLDNKGGLIREKKWSAQRRLSHDLLGEIEKITRKDFTQLAGLIVFVGPGSFTGLRIGITTMNSLAYSLGIPIVGVSGDDWVTLGQERLGRNENDTIVLPEYGAEANISKPKK